MKRHFITTLIILYSSLSHGLSSDIFSQATNAAVLIQTNIIHGFTEDKEAEKTTEGSGFLIDKKNGFIMTNAHVAGRGVSDIFLRFHKQRRSINAKKYFVDPYHDVAILKIDPESIPLSANQLSLDCDYDLKRGEEIFAIGHPENTEFQITRGVVSGEFDNDVDGIFWSTDLVIEPGSSGGAAISYKSGQVIGIATAGWDESDISLLTKSRDICTIWNPIKNDRSPTRPLIGFQQMMVDGYLSKYIGLVFDANLPLKTGDLIHTWNHGKIWNINQHTRFSDLLRGFNGKSFELTVIRDDKKLSFDIPLKKGISHESRDWVYFTGLTFAENLQEDGNFIVGYYPNRVVRLQSIKISESEIMGLEVPLRAILHSIDGQRITSIKQLHTILHNHNSTNKDTRLRFVFNASDVTPEAWRYLFTRDILVKDLQSNLANSR